MPRQLSIAETAKQRSLRVPLDYYRGGDRLTRTKFMLAALAGLAAVVYCAWLFASSRAGRRQLSPGPVAAAHAAWNDDCNACHQDFRPLRSDAIDWRGMLLGASAVQAPADQACTKCHNEPAHHQAALAGEVPGCAACHQDHHSSAADIRRAADVQCLACHENLAAHRQGASGLTPPVASVTAFAASSGNEPPHPDFRSLTSDPGNVKFNHWLHLQPGIAPADAKQKLKVADAAARYQGYANAAGLVELNCGACHEPNEDGRLMRPIAYERHCGGCHPLNVAVGQSAASVPHGLAATRLGEAIDGLLFQATKSAPAQDLIAADESGQTPLIPGRTLGRNLAQKIQADVLGRRKTIVAVVNAKCRQCHDRADGAADEPVEVRPANIPARWLQHGRFDHAAHRHTECRTCHQAAYAFEERDKARFLAAGSFAAAGASLARDAEQVMIAGIESCVACHAPRRGATGGARHDCSACHEYHGRETHASRERTSGPRAAQVHFVALQASDAPLESANMSSCAASGCHGAVGGTGAAWQSAFATWAAHDPHVQAYDVLFTARGREMTRLLDRQSEVLNDAAHQTVLAGRCTGCHAASDEASRHLGVGCAECHGAADGWLHAHYRSGFKRSASAGFLDLNELPQRASVCMPCHVGPSTTGGQVVDHDLIAAGHPRLAFEFRSYHESLPAHWDRVSDERERPANHHFQLWLVGQEAQAAAEARLSKASAPIDFAQQDCFRCHHALAGDESRQTHRSGALVRVTTKPELWQPLAGRTQLTVQDRLDFFERRVASTASDPTFDTCVAAYLAGTAVTGDLPQPETLPMRKPLEALGGYLARECYPGMATGAGQQPTIYDSPSGFTPRAAEARLRGLQEAVSKAKKQGG